MSRSGQISRLVLGVLIGAICFVLSDEPTKAHLSFDRPLYEFGLAGCTETPMGDGDWVNLVFVGARNQAEVQKLLTRYLGWRTGQGGSIACFKDHGVLEPED